MTPEKSPLILSYDSARSCTAARLRTVLIAYLLGATLGLAITGLAHAIFSIFSPTDSLALTLIFGFPSLLLALPTLAILLALHRRFSKRGIYFIRFRTIFIITLVIGLAPWQSLSFAIFYYQGRSGLILSMSIPLLYHTLAAAIASIILCRRTPLRD